GSTVHLSLPAVVPEKDAVTFCVPSSRTSTSLSGVTMPSTTGSATQVIWTLVTSASAIVPLPLVTSHSCLAGWVFTDTEYVPPPARPLARSRLPLAVAWTSRLPLTCSTSVPPVR